MDFSAPLVAPIEFSVSKVPENLRSYTSSTASIHVFVQFVMKLCFRKSINRRIVLATGSTPFDRNLVVIIEVDTGAVDPGRAL